MALEDVKHPYNVMTTKLFQLALDLSEGEKPVAAIDKTHSEESTFSVTIALQDGHGSFTIGETTLQGWFDQEAGSFVLPFVNLDSFKESMVQLIVEMEKVDAEGKAYWESQSG